MARTICAGLRQAIFSRGFIISAAGTAPHTPPFLRAGHIIRLPLGGAAFPRLPQRPCHGRAVVRRHGVGAAYPLRAAVYRFFHRRRKSGFIKEYLPCTTVPRYIVGKAAACAISGGLVLALGIFIAYGFAALLFLPMEAYPKPGESVPNYFGNLMETALMFFASGAFWSLVGLTFAALTNSKYMAYASPFVLFYLLIILYERYFDKLFVLYPREWLNPSSKWMFGKIGVAVLLLEFGALMALAFAYAAKRRLERI